MSAVLFVLASLVATSLAAPSTKAADCVPDQSKFYWTSPCDGQGFQNRVTVSAVDATQNGKEVDDAGGFDISVPIDLSVDITDNYGDVADPKIDVSIKEYTKGASGNCEWVDVPTLGLLDNIDGCTVVDNCHMTGSPTNIKAKIDIKTLAGPLYGGIDVNTYYGLSMTFKDGKDTKFLCVYSQDIVIAK
jgi:hypothetical protein